MEDPAQSDCQRQLPLPSSEPVPHVGFVQHLMSVSSLGQALEMNFPPEEVHFEVAMQTPGQVSGILKVVEEDCRLKVESEEGSRNRECGVNVPGLPPSPMQGSLGAQRPVQARLATMRT
jgi:hypothetical protein